MNQEQTRYKELVEHLNDAVYTVDIGTLEFTSVNGAAEKLTGFTKKELLGMQIVKVITPESLPTVKRMINLKKRKASSTIYEIEVLRQDGVKVPVEISSIAIYEDGKPTEILGVARDITERKIHETQRNVFLSLMTHEIKNPLTTIIGYLGFLKKKLSHDPTSLSYLSTVLSQAEAINILMNDFLDASQMRIGKFKISKEEFDLNEVIKEASLPYEKNAHIKINGKITKKIKADKRRISQVISNLLSNAVKYSGGNKEILIKLGEEGGKVTVSVQDFGIGISKSNQKHIFELFVRVKGGNTSEIKGHGLGLFVCREIIKLHKGRLWVESEPGKGSTFYFSIPR